MQENPIFADLNAEDDDDSDVDSESSSSSSSEESSSESDGDNEKIKLNVPKHYNVVNTRKKKPVCFPGRLNTDQYNNDAMFCDVYVFSGGCCSNGHMQLWVW